MINQFKDEYFWLSNFCKCSITIHDFTYPTVENAYHSQKSIDINWKLKCQNGTPSYIKRESRKLEIDVKEWDKRKVKVMEKCINLKFNQEPFKSLLLATKDEEIQEGNTWGDEFWGINLKNGKGLNYLGKLIMNERNKLRGILF